MLQKPPQFIKEDDTDGKTHYYFTCLLRKKNTTLPFKGIYSVDGNTYSNCEECKSVKEAHLTTDEAWYAKLSQVKEMKISVAKLSLKDRINL